MLLVHYHAVSGALQAFQALLFLSFLSFPFLPSSSSPLLFAQGLYALQRSAEGKLEIATAAASGQQQSPVDLSDVCRGNGPIVVEVCGGSLVTAETIDKWRADFDL